MTVAMYAYSHKLLEKIVILRLNLILEEFKKMNIIINLIVYLIVFGLIWWIVSLLPLPSPIAQIVRVLFLILLLLIVLSAVGIIPGHYLPPIRL